MASEPKFMPPRSAGVDLFSAVREPVCLNNMGAREIIPTGISIELPVGFEAQIRPRSGLAAKFGITVLNTPGTIDSDYRGEIGVILVNLSTKRFFVEPISLVDAVRNIARGVGTKSSEAPQQNG